MTLPRVPFMTGGGASHSAEQVRLALTGLIATSEGIVTPDACQVTETAVPGSQVRVTDGGLLVRGRVQPWQGLYSAYNIGDHLVSVPATGASPRNDLLVVRVEDPGYEGSLDPLVDNIIYPHLIPNVPAGARTLEDAGQGGMSAVPLARIEIPASTATITDAMIFDVRELANPRRSYFQDSQQIVATQLVPDVTLDQWPGDATWEIDVPPWATQMDVIVTLQGIQHVTDPGQCGGDLRWNFADGQILGPLVFNRTEILNTRNTFGASGSATIPAALRGTSELLILEARRSNGAGRWEADDGSAAIAQVFFTEAPELTF